MKNLFLNLTFASFFIAASNNAMATYVDNLDTVLLMHCDATNQVYWLITPDDNSSGRSADAPILNKTNAPLFEFDYSTVPALTTGSFNGSSFLRFDGTNDSIYCSPGWPGGINASCDFSMRWFALPSTNDPYAALIQAVAWRSFLIPVEDKGYISFVTSGGWVSSSKLLDSNIWYDIHFSIIGDQAKLIVDGTTNEANVYINDQSSQITIGYDIYGAGRFFNGDLDEIRVDTIPEPCLQIIICLLFIVHRIKKI